MLGQGADRLADRLGQIEADREADPPLAGPVEQLVGGAGRVAAQEDLDLLDAIGGDLLERRLGDRDLVRRGVGAGVAGPQDGGGGLARLVEVGEQGVKAEATLEVASRACFSEWL